MPRAPGWAERPVGSTTVTVGTTALVVPVPAGWQPTDTLFLILGHKGADWGVVPAAWTLVAREVSGTTRAEVYTRLAASEPASYTITGLATVAMGVIVPYAGGTLINPLIDVMSVRANASGTGLPAGTRQSMAPSITTTVPQAMLLAVVIAGSNDGFPVVRTRKEGTTAGPVDFAIERFVDRRTTGISTGGGLWLYAGDLIKIVPGVTGETYLDAPGPTTFSGTSIGFLLALRPDTVTATTGTRYYLSAKYPTTAYFWGPWQGGWQANVMGPRVDVQDVVWLLSQTKSDAGVVRIGSEIMTTNQTPSDQLYLRWVTPPLAAQTISGTFDLVSFFSVWQESPDSPVCYGQIKLHVYVTVGQSTAVRGVLLNRYVDPTLRGNFFDAWVTLASPQTLAAVACEAGDSVIVELGVRVTTSGTWPVPNVRPNDPDDYASFRLNRGGTVSQAVYGSGFFSGIGAADASLTDIDPIAQNRAPHFDFSHTFVELPNTNPIPTHTTYPTAKPILSLPFTDGPIDSSQVSVPQREVWYSWTPDRDGRVILHTWGSGYGVRIFVYLNPATGGTADTVSRVEKQVVTSMAVAVVDVTAGVPVYIVCRSIRNGLNAPETGGRLFLTVRWRTPLAHNDVILATAGYLVRYTAAGVLAEVQTDFAGLALSGLAIDYTHRPMEQPYHDEAPPHTADRLYLGIFGLDYIEILDLATLNVGEAEIDFLSDPLYDGYSLGANFNLSSLAFSPTGRLCVGWFGNGFTLVADHEGSYQFQAATNQSADINVTDGLFADSQSGSPFPPAVRWPVPVEAGGTNYIELAPDGHTLFYTSGGWYVPVGGQTIYRVDIETGVQAPFATVPPGPGINPGLKGLFPLLDGGCLVCNGGEVVRLNAAGVIVQHYTPTPSDRAQSLADVEMDSDNEFFWVLDERTTTLFKFNLATGVQVIDLWTQLGLGSSTSLVIYRRPAQPTVLVPRGPDPLKIHYYGYAVQPPTSTHAPLGLAPEARLDVYLADQAVHQTLGVKVESSQPLGNPFAADREGYFSTYVVARPIDLVQDVAGGRVARRDVLVLDPRVADLEQRVAAIYLARAGGA